MAHPLMKYFEAERPRLEHIAEQIAVDPQQAVDAAADRFAALAPDFPYADEPDHAMASSIHVCNAHLMLFLVLREEGIDAHQYGVTVHATPKELRAELPQASFKEFRAAAEQSKTDPKPGRFEFEYVESEEYPVAMNITSCALCIEFGKHDAIDLVPYMCHNDDVASDELGQRLRRTGTIALGASHCDFRFGAKEPLDVASQYPGKIRLGTEIPVRRRD